MDWYTNLSIIAASASFALGAYLTVRNDLRKRTQKNQAIADATAHLSMIRKNLFLTGSLEHPVLGPPLCSIDNTLRIVIDRLNDAKDI